MTWMEQGYVWIKRTPEVVKNIVKNRCRHSHSHENINHENCDCGENPIDDVARSIERILTVGTYAGCVLGVVGGAVGGAYVGSTVGGVPGAVLGGIVGGISGLIAGGLIGNGLAQLLIHIVDKIKEIQFAISGPTGCWSANGRVVLMTK